MKLMKQDEILTGGELCLFALTGILTGLIITAYKSGLKVLSGLMRQLLTFTQNNPLYSWLFVLALLLIGLIVYMLTLHDPDSLGSGIPVLYALIDRKKKNKWQRTLPLRFITSLLTVGSGLTLGREGPSVQMGGLVGQGVRELYAKEAEPRYFIGAGAGAALAVAFNAPFAGICFSLEEMIKRFNKKAVCGSIVTVFFAVIASDCLLPNVPLLQAVPKFQLLSLRQYFIVALIGILAGLSGCLFNFLILNSNFLYRYLPRQFVLPFTLIALLILCDPRLFGVGENMLEYSLKENVGLTTLIYFYLMKLLLLALAFGINVPGGTLVPLLVSGALLGNIYGTLLANLGQIDSSMIFFFVLLGMCGHFAAIVRTPLTAIILVWEISGGALAYMLCLVLVSLLAYVTAEFLRVPPFYEYLYDKMLQSLPAKGETPASTLKS